MDANDDENDPIHVLLREHTGREAPPDLCGAVVARLRAGDAPRAAGRLRWQATTAGPARRQRWLVAAVAALGLGAVGGTVWLQQHATDAQAQAPLPQEPTRQDPAPVAAGVVQLRVLDLHGGPVQSFELELLRRNPQPNLQTLTRIQGFPARRVEPRDFTGDSTSIAGLVDGTYVAVVTATGHARTRSEPFTLAGQGAQVTVRLDVGGDLHGIVHGPDGKPLAGATVRTVAPPPPGLNAAATLAQILMQNTVQLQTEAQVRTGDDGTWKLRKLSYGNYRVLFEHPDFCDGTPALVEVAAGDREVPAVTLQQGARLRGKVTADGKAIADVEVTLRGGEPGADLGADTPMWKAKSGADGTFALPSKVPPGTYTIQGVRLGQTANPFDKILEIKNSQRAVVVRPGDHALEQDVELGGG